MTEAMIKTEGLHKSFGGNHVLRGVSLDFPAGTTTVILGGSGSGKSVLMKHLIGLLMPDEGKVIVDGQDITQLEGEAMNHVRAKFGMVFQWAALFDSMNVLDNVAFPLREHRKELSEEEIAKLVAEKLAMFGLEGIEQKFPADLSGGMRKRVGLARAIILDPKIVLYDEPTTGLDPITTDYVDEMIKRAKDRLGVTSVVISHDIASTFNIADYIAFLYEGEIVAYGPPATVKESEHEFVQQFLGDLVQKELMAQKKDKVVTPLKVGLLVSGSFVALMIFLQIVSTQSLGSANSYDVWALFDDVLGLEKKSPVQIAGVDIGRIKEIELSGGKAKVTLEINGEVALFEDAKIEKVSISLLGDYKLAVEPGTSDQRRLKDGDQIKNVISLSSVDAVVAEVRTMSEALKKMIAGTPEQPAPLEQIVRDVQGSATAARNVLEVVSKDIGENAEKLDRILGNIEAFTKDLSTISRGKDNDIDAITTDARAIAASLRVTAENLEKIVAGQDEKDLKDTVTSLRQTLDTMNRSLDNIASITQKIDEGQGTVGGLINDSSVHEGVKDAVEGVNKIIGGVSRMQTWVNLRSEFQFRTGAAKNYVQFVLKPSEDAYYLFEVVDDPRGVRETEIVDVETTSPEEGRDFQYRERRTTTRDKLSFSLLFGKRFYWLGLRFGVIEGTGGVGADLHFLDDRLEFYFDLNRFGEEERLPRIKGLALVEIIPHVYLHAGVDDAFNIGTIDYFVGAGVRFNDQDLLTILALAGSAVTGGGN